MIGVILPTRGRVEWLRESVTSLRDAAMEPENVRIAYGVDPDDPETEVETARLLQPGDTLTVFPERHGYSRLHDYVNHLAATLIERGCDWLLLWNDDARMLTHEWDRLIERYTGSNIVLDPQTNHDNGMMLFPILPARLAAALGHVSLSPHYDTWWEQLADSLDLRRPVEIQISHAPYGFHQDQTAIESRAGRRTHEYFGPEMAALRAQDVETLRRFLAEREPRDPTPEWKDPPDEINGDVSSL